MYTILTKWTPGSNNFRYLSFPEIEYAIVNNNLASGLPIIDPSIYNFEIFDAWDKSLRNYQNYFVSQLKGIDYQFFKNDQGIVITAIFLDSESDFIEMTNASFYSDFVKNRQNFADLIGVSFEIKRTQANVGPIDNFDVADEIFNAI